MLTSNIQSLLETWLRSIKSSQKIRMLLPKSLVLTAIDSCDNVTCGDNAICIDGVCDCAPGFEGDGQICNRKLLS